jgi:hypothetical protein
MLEESNVYELVNEFTSQVMMNKPTEQMMMTQGITSMVQLFKERSKNSLETHQSMLWSGVDEFDRIILENKAMNLNFTNTTDPRV